MTLLAATSCALDALELLPRFCELYFVFFPRDDDAADDAAPSSSGGPEELLPAPNLTGYSISPMNAGVDKFGAEVELLEASMRPFGAQNSDAGPIRGGKRAGVVVDVEDVLCWVAGASSFGDAEED